MPDRTPVGPGTRVTLRFSLFMSNGELVDSTGDKPATFSVGDGNLLPGFESAMFGLVAGDSRRLRIDAQSAFGPHREENVQRMRRSEFQRDLELEEGLVVSFADQQKAELPGVVVSVGDEIVVVDFNHPLAGHDLEFEVEILDVEQVSNEIARTGGAGQ